MVEYNDTIVKCAICGATDKTIINLLRHIPDKIPLWLIASCYVCTDCYPKILEEVDNVCRFRPNDASRI